MRTVWKLKFIILSQKDSDLKKLYIFTTKFVTQGTYFLERLAARVRAAFLAASLRFIFFNLRVRAALRAAAFRDAVVCGMMIVF